MEIKRSLDTNTDDISDEPNAKRKKSNPFSALLKEEREKRRQKKSRIIIRNISYKATEDSLKEHFSKFGNIVDLNLLKRPDGKLVGCAFIQYEAVNQAAKAIAQATNKEYLGRPVFVDWAVGKDEYTKKSNDSTEIKDEKPEETIKIEEDDHSIKSDIKSDNEDDEEEGDDDNDDDGGEDNSPDSSEDENESYKKEEDSDNEESKEKKSKQNIKLEQSKRISNDVNEGCTVFIKNIPFDATDNDLRKVCRKYGPLYYAVITKDRISGHSKGTGFVKFKIKESADLCLVAGETFVLMDTILEPFPAMSRDEIQNKNENSKKSENKDSRNLYLAKEGLIMTGSKAAEGVSASDMAKRHKLEQVKTQVLKNLNRFVSRNRLSIHNLPKSYDNEKLRQLIIEHTNFKPHECRVMRETKITGDHPQGESKGFGFMSFNTHQDALAALRKLNNNPKMFGNINRPIVGFSIEDRAVHKLKENRVQRSKLNNPTYQKKLEENKAKKLMKKQNQPLIKDNKSKIQKQIKQLEKLRNKKPVSNPADHMDEYAGVSAKPGTFVRMRSMKKIREQAQEHKKKVGQQKRVSKQKKIKQEHRLEKMQDVPTRKGEKRQEVDNFSHLVNKYKRMIETNSATKELPVKTKAKRTKWYKD